MANVDGAFGFRPVRHMSGNIQTEEFQIAANYGTAIYTGQTVEAVAGGGVEAAAAGDTQQAGVFGGVSYTDPTTSKPTWSNYYPGSVVASDIMAFVIDDPSVVFKMDVNDDLNTTFIFQNFDVTNVTGSTVTGISKVQLNRSTNGVKTTQAVRVIDVSQDPDNEDQTASNVKALVVINNHFYGNKGAGI